MSDAFSALFASTPQARSALLADARAALERHRDEHGDADPAGEADRRGAVAAILLADGRYADAVAERERAYVLTKSARGPDHADTARRLRDLAEAYEEAGNLAPAESFARLAYERAAALVPDDAPDRWAFAFVLGSALHARGRFTEAAVYADEAVRRAAARHGEDAPETHRARVQAAIIANHYAGTDGHAVYRAARAAFRDAYGEGALLVAVMDMNAAQSVSAPDEEPEAADAAGRALAVGEAYCGPDHPFGAGLLLLRSTLAAHAGDQTAQEAHARAAREHAARTLGADHPRRALYLNCHGVALDGLGRHEEAETAYRDALALQERFAPDHPETATTLLNLAAGVNRRGDVRGAERLLRRAFDIRAATLSPLHPGLVDLAGMAAMIYRAGGQPRASEALARWGLFVAEHVPEVGPERTGALWQALGLASGARGRWRESAEAHEAARRLLFPILAEDAEGRYFLDVNVGYSLLKIGRRDDAWPHWRDVLAFRAARPAADPHDWATASNNAGVIYQDAGDDIRAEPLLRAALAVHENDLSLSHPDAVVVARNLATTLKRVGRPDAAEVERLAALLGEIGALAAVPKS